MPTVHHRPHVQIKKDGSHGASLAETIVHWDTVKQGAINSELCQHVLMESTNDVDKLWWNTQTWQHLPRTTARHSIICFLQINKNEETLGFVFNDLLFKLTD